MSSFEDQTWAARAACRQVEPDELFVRGAAQRAARELCFRCPVRMECLADALDAHVTFGVWGGLTERERRALLRRYPEVASWTERLKDEDDDVMAELRAERAPRILAKIRQA
ncbi:WhiB family transcriptional regulator [Georgenia sp. 311]|uniref:Transcriptional regulator WhiB n=1 Tax=Georgenia wutianyii TaxID=2585135 RepID=A0ABX5VIG9_9MICO|nr:MULTISPECIES: WhiB family transcriptional regulator [Georgenia]QDB78094.1 WhiB family transcriptional regulator [Georgenia wutianyii]TNC17538.1 WhiB family transcriptional regulator [Georgenia sp. 311]